MKISLIIGLITLVIGSLGQNCPSFFSGEDCSEIQCVNGGYPDSTAKVCTCPPGYLGIHCEAVKTSRPPNNHYKAGGTSFNILNVNLYTQYWGVKTYQNIRKAIKTFQSAYKFDVYNYGFNKNSPFLDTFDDPQGFPINFSTTDTKTPLSLDPPIDTGLYWCYQVDIYENLVLMIRDRGLRNTAITIITQHPPSSDYLEEAQQTTVAFGIRVNVLWISDKTFNLCQDSDIAAFKAFSELTGGLFVQLQSELDDAPTQNLVSQVLLTHYRPQFVSIQSFKSCDSPQSVPVVIDPVVKGPYNFVFLGTNASPTQQSFVSCLLQQPLRSFDNQLSIFQSPDPACLSVSVKATGPCTVMVFTNGNYSNPGPIDLSIYTSYVEDQTIDSSRYGIVEGVPFYPAIHVEPPSLSSQVTVNSISASFDSSWNPVLQNRFPAAYEWIPSKTITCDSTKTYSLFLNISVDFNIVQRAVRVACLAVPPATTIPPVTYSTAATTDEASTTTSEAPTTTILTTPGDSTDTTDTTSSTEAPTTSVDPSTLCDIGENLSSFLFAYATDSNTATFALVEGTIVQAVANNQNNYTNLGNVRIDTKNGEDITYSETSLDFSTACLKDQPNATLAADPIKDSDVLGAIRQLLNSGKRIENSMIVILANRLPRGGADLTDTEYDTLTNKNIKIFPLLSLSSLVEESAVIGRTAAVYNRIAAQTNGHFVVANDTIGGRDVNSDLNKIVNIFMQTAYIQNLLFTRNIGINRLGTNIGTVRIPNSSTGKVSVTITVTLSAVDVNVPQLPTRLFLGFKPNGNDTKTVSIDFLNSATTYANSNFYTTTVELEAGYSRELFLQYVPGPDQSDLLIRMWVTSQSYHHMGYVGFAETHGFDELIQVDEFVGAAVRVKLYNDCYDDKQGTLLITDCNGQVSTKYDTDQIVYTRAIFTDEGSDPHYPFIPFFCDSVPANPTCVTGSSSKYDFQFVADDFSVSRSFQCRPGVGAMKDSCKLTDANGNHQCSGPSPFMRGPTGMINDCSNHGHLEYDSEIPYYACVCDDGYSGLSCEVVNCTAPNTDPLATDNSYHTYTVVLGLDKDISTPDLVMQDAQVYLGLAGEKLATLPKIWKYQLITYCSDGQAQVLYSGGDVSAFQAAFSLNVVCTGSSTAGAVDLTTVYQQSVKGIGRNVKGVIAYYTETSKILNVTLNEFIVASNAYQQQLFVYLLNEGTLNLVDDKIAQAVMTTGGFLIQSWIDNLGNIDLEPTFIPALLKSSSSIAWYSSAQDSDFYVNTETTTSKAYLISWKAGTSLKENGNNNILRGCSTAGDVMAMCPLTDETTYSLKGNTGSPYYVAVFVLNDVAPQAIIISDLSQDASNAVSTSTSSTRTILSISLPSEYTIVGNDGDGGVTRNAQRNGCSFGWTAYSVFATEKYQEGANVAKITIQDKKAVKYTRFFAFGTATAPVCQNGGTPVASTGSCSCPSGFQGPDCSLVNCELASSANAWSDVYPTFCQYPKWSFTFFLAYSRQLSPRQYNETVIIVPKALKNYPYQDNVLRNAYLDYEENEVIGLPKDLNSFTTNILSSPPNPLAVSLNSSNLIQIIQNFIPTAQETSEYSGKTTNWLENSILLLLPAFLPNVADTDLSADNYTSFINRNVKVFIVMSIAEVNAEERRYPTDLKIFSNLAAKTNGHWVIVSDSDYGRVLEEVMDFGYGKDMIFTRNVGNITGTRELGSLKTPGSLISSLINVTITITESVIPKYPAFMPELKIRIKGSNGGFDNEIDMIDYRHKMSNFYLASIQLPSESTYSLSVTYIPPTTASRDLLIRIWTDRNLYQYSEFVDLSFYPTDPNDKDGAAMRMTVLNNCYQQERADIVITDCNGLVIRKDDEEQVSGVPIGTEGSYPKFAFVPYFCDVQPRQGSDGCVEGAEGKYDVQLTVGTYSISRSFQCLPGTQPFNPKCTQKDSNGNYYCTRDTVPYKRGPTGQLTDCLGHGNLEFDSEVAEDYVCICDKGWGGQSCEKSI